MLAATEEMTAETARAARWQHRVADGAFPRGTLTEPRRACLGTCASGGAKCFSGLRGADVIGGGCGGIAERRQLGAKLLHVVQYPHDAAGLVEVVGVVGEIRACFLESRNSLVQARRQVGT